MASSKLVHRDDSGINRSASIIIPSDSDSETNFDERQETVTVTESNPFRLVAAKRKAPDQPSPIPLGKRTRVSHPARDVPGEATLQKPPHDPRFWYLDGNVVIKVEDTYFKLFRSRLVQQCRYFQRLFSPPSQSQPQPSSSTDGASCTGVGGGAPFKELDGCAVYEVSGIAVSDFTTFLNFLEYPLEHSVSTAPGEKLYPLLRASNVLGCALVHDLAKKAVAKQWPSLQPPKRNADSRWSAASRPRASDAIQAIVHARKYRIPLVLKCAFYELLRNTAFWEAVDHTHTNSRVALPERESSADRDLLAPLSRGDLVRLQQARWKLREAWDALLRTPPGSDAGWKGTTCTVCPPAQNGRPLTQSRTDAWAIETAHAGERVSKFGDPIAGTYLVEDWLDSLKRHSRGKWCEGCLEERKYAWREARTTWWQHLDGWLQTGLGVSVARRVPLRASQLHERLSF
ncbi:hypothetical protein V8D89_014373 [Ganoderma adspersum]